MYEVFVMSLKEYWNELGEEAVSVEESIAELQDVLSEHFEKEIRWKEPALSPEESEEDIAVDALTEELLTSLHIVAGKLELDGELGDVEIPEFLPWESPIFDRLSALADEDKDIQRFNHILSLGNCREYFAVPADFPFVTEVNLSDEEHSCEDEDCVGGCEAYDEDSVDIASQTTLRRELDDLAKVLALDTSIGMNEIEEIEFDDEDPFKAAKLAWYILSSRLNEAIEAKLPLILRYRDDEELDELEDFEDEE